MCQSQNQCWTVQQGVTLATRVSVEVVTDPSLLASLTAAATCVTAGPPSLRITRAQRVHPLGQLLDCIRVRRSCLSKRSAKTTPVRRSFATKMGVASPLHSRCTQVAIDHRALDASDVDVQEPLLLPATQCLHQWHVRHHMAFPLGVRSIAGSSSACDPNLHSSWPSSAPPGCFAPSSHTFTSHGSYGLSFI